MDKNDSLSSVLLTIYSNKAGYFEQFAVGTKDISSDQTVQKNSQFHSASVGKTMCATIFGMLVDEGRINYDDKIRVWLDDDILEGLFVLDSMDYSGQVTIRHLLSHTSGVGDYFEDPVKSGKTMLEIITGNPDLLYTPEKLIAFTRENQEPVGKPGEQFHYSDTGYILLGLILEAIEEKTYSDILEERIFEPLDMKDSYLMFYNDEPTDILGIYIDGINFSNKNALSVDWSGGGIVTTMDNLLKFMMALENGDLLSSEAYKQMTDFKESFDKGIYYGVGMMYFDFSELSFMLGSMTDVYGGMGATKRRIPAAYVLDDESSKLILRYDPIDKQSNGIYPTVVINWAVVHAKKQQMDSTKFNRTNENLMKTKQFHPALYQATKDMDLTIRYSEEPGVKTKDLKGGKWK